MFVAIYRAATTKRINLTRIVDLKNLLKEIPSARILAMSRDRALIEVFRVGKIEIYIAAKRVNLKIRR